MRLHPRAPNPATSRAEPCYFVVLAVVGGLLTGCGWGDPGGSGGSGDKETVHVLAASSLTDVFEELAEVFEEEHPGVEVELSFGSSTDLAEQAADGAPGDVLATADAASLAAAGDAVTGDSVLFATNELVIVTPPDDPGGVSLPSDLAGTTWVRCADEAPCGRVALDVLADHDVDAEPASLEEDVRSTLDKVVSGEADAGLVYASDAASAGEAVRTLEVPGAEEHEAAYFLVALDQAADRDLAQQWIDLVTTPAVGGEALEAAGFGLP